MQAIHPRMVSVAVRESHCICHSVRDTSGGHVCRDIIMVIVSCNWVLAFVVCYVDLVMVFVWASAAQRFAVDMVHACAYAHTALSNGHPSQPLDC